MWSRRVYRRLLTMATGSLLLLPIYHFLHVLMSDRPDDIHTQLQYQGTALAPNMLQVALRASQRKSKWRNSSQKTAPPRPENSGEPEAQEHHRGTEGDESNDGGTPTSKIYAQNQNISSVVGNTTTSAKFPKKTDHIRGTSQPHRHPSSRLSLVSDVCRSHGSHIVGNVEKVYIYEAQKVAYCSTHKIASTFWIRIYRWLYNDTRSGHVASPLLISKFDTHLLPLKRLKVRNITKNEESRALVDSSFRFLFTRDPYARLWSVYIDKFVLPDNYFWGFYSPKIKASVYGKGLKTLPVAHIQTNQTQTFSLNDGIKGSQYRHSVNQLNSTRTEQHEQYLPKVVQDGQNLTSGHGQGLESSERKLLEKDHVALRRLLETETKQKSSCQQVTFQEFLQYIVKVAASQTGRALDDHFRPVHYGCNPCQYRPHLIGHMETMRDDSARVLKQMRLERILPDLNTNHIEQEIDMVIDFNFDLVVKKRYQKSCVTNTDLERRLIKAFVYNGYFPAENQTWLESQLPLGQANLKKAVLNLYHNSGKTSDDLKMQKERFRLEAFRKVPRDLLSAIQEVFYWDFELFGYDPFPPEIFKRT